MNAWRCVSSMRLRGWACTGSQKLGPVSAPSARDILSCAAILHDIGYVEGYEEHHKTAYG
jgi:hypothetical protein